MASQPESRPPSSVLPQNPEPSSYDAFQSIEPGMLNVDLDGDMLTADARFVSRSLLDSGMASGTPQRLASRSPIPARPSNPEPCSDTTLYSVASGSSASRGRLAIEQSSSSRGSQRESAISPCRPKEVAPTADASFPERRTSRPFPETSMQEDAAATRIQSMYRGRVARTFTQNMEIAMKDCDLDVPLELDMMKADSKMRQPRQARQSSTGSLLSIDRACDMRSVSPAPSACSPLPDRPMNPEPFMQMEMQAASDDAARSIQTAYRGSLARRLSGSGSNAVTTNSTELEHSSLRTPGTELDSGPWTDVGNDPFRQVQEQEAAASRIQAAYRGTAARNCKNMQDASPEPTSDICNMDSDLDVDLEQEMMARSPDRARKGSKSRGYRLSVTSAGSSSCAARSVSPCPRSPLPVRPMNPEPWMEMDAKSLSEDEAARRIQTAFREAKPRGMASVPPVRSPDWSWQKADQKLTGLGAADGLSNWQVEKAELNATEEVTEQDLAALPATLVDAHCLRQQIMQLLTKGSLPDSKTKLLVYIAARPAMAPILEVLANNVSRSHALNCKAIEVGQRIAMQHEVARKLEGDLAAARVKAERLRADGERLAAELATAEEKHQRLQERQEQLLLGLGEQSLKLLHAQLDADSLEERSHSTACTERDLLTNGGNPPDNPSSFAPRQVDMIGASMGVPSTTRPALATAGYSEYTGKEIDRKSVV